MYVLMTLCGLQAKVCCTTQEDTRARAVRALNCLRGRVVGKMETQTLMFSPVVHMSCRDCMYPSVGRGKGEETEYVFKGPN